MIGGIPVWDTSPMEVRAKERGIARAGSAHYRDLDLAREIARELASDGRAISADDVRAAMLERWPDTEFGNWMGGCFRGPGWRAVGFVHSRTKGSHANRLISWRLA